MKRSLVDYSDEDSKEEPLIKKVIKVQKFHERGTYPSFI